MIEESKELQKLAKYIFFDNKGKAHPTIIFYVSIILLITIIKMLFKILKSKIKKTCQ